MDKISVSRAEEKYKRLIMIFLNFSEHERRKTDKKKKRSKRQPIDSWSKQVQKSWKLASSPILVIVYQTIIRKFKTHTSKRIWFNKEMSNNTFILAMLISENADKSAFSLEISSKDVQFKSLDYWPECQINFFPHHCPRTRLKKKTLIKKKTF